MWLSISQGLIISLRGLSIRKKTRMERKGGYSDPLKLGKRVALILDMSILFRFFFFSFFFFSMKGNNKHIVGFGCTVAIEKYRILNLPL